MIGRGYDHFKLDVGRHPYREELDAAAPDHPVYIVRTCGHLAVANSRALALAGIGELPLRQFAQCHAAAGLG